MLLDQKDTDLLEFVTLDEPWSMVCGEFCSRYGSIESLVARLFIFEHTKYLTIRPDDGAAPPTAIAFLADAIAHDNYEEAVVSKGPAWTLVATDKGFAAVRGGFKEQ